MIVVYPDGVAVSQLICDFSCEYLIDSCVCVPRILVEGDLARVVVEKWPEDLI